MTSTADTKRLPRALFTFTLWIVATLFGMRWLSDGTKKPLVDTVTHGISWNLVMAVVVLAIATMVWRWNDLRFVTPRPASSLKVLWFPMIFVVLFLAVALFIGLPPPATVLFVAINTAIVGLSEEWMFRGVIFRALRTRIAIWPAIIATSLMFGAVHVLNVFVTGQLGEGILQATAAAMSGLIFAALLIRTGSIWVPIVYHALWDFVTFMLVSGMGQNPQPQATGTMPTYAYLFPLLLVLPNFLYALYLLRNVGRDTRLDTD